MHQNKITLTLLPTQEIKITLNAKEPGLKYALEQQILSFSCKCDNNTIEAYQKVLLDCIMGDSTLFTKTDEVIASWKFINSILSKWHNLPLMSYKQGGTGPNITKQQS